MAAGDQLRVVYDQLSRDPASLSNLDQDLPNYAQHQVPIFSLPQVRALRFQGFWSFEGSGCRATGAPAVLFARSAAFWTASRACKPFSKDWAVHYATGGAPAPLEHDD